MLRYTFNRRWVRRALVLLSLLLLLTLLLFHYWRPAATPQLLRLRAWFNDPIAHALAWPARMAASVPPLDLIALGKLEFFAPDPVRFPALRLSREALRAGGGAPTILNAANEIAVGLFLEKRLRFLDIAAVVEETLSRLGAPEAADLPAIMAHDDAARSEAGLIAAERAALV